MEFPCQLLYIVISQQGQLALEQLKTQAASYKHYEQQVQELTN